MNNTITQVKLKQDGKLRIGNGEENTFSMLLSSTLDPAAGCFSCPFYTSGRASSGIGDLEISTE